MVAQDCKKTNKDKKMKNEIRTNSIISGSNKSLNFFDGNFYIHGEFDQTILTDVIPHLVNDIKNKEKQRDAIISFYIDSCGGYTNVLKNLLGLIQIAKSKDIIIETYVFGMAYSCGSILAMMGTRGHRYIGENAEHLCHLGAGSTGYVETDLQLERSAARIKAHFDFVRDIYAKNSKIKNLSKVISDDNFFIRGRDIIENGLADRIIGL